MQKTLCDVCEKEINPQQEEVANFLVAKKRYLPAGSFPELSSTSKPGEVASMRFVPEKWDLCGKCGATIEKKLEELKKK